MVLGKKEAEGKSAKDNNLRTNKDVEKRATSLSERKK